MAILAATASLAGRRTRNRHILSTIVALGLLTSSATIVHLSGGAIEAHFHFFVMMSVLLLYEDWLPYAAAFAYVVLHHGTVGVLSPENVYNHGGAIAHPWRWALVHGLFVSAAGAANIVNWRLNETARHDARAASSRADLSELRFTVAFDNAPIGVALVAADGHWLNVNQALLNIIGYSREELLQMNFQSITHPEDLPNDLEHLGRVVRGEIDAYGLEKRYIHVSGRVIWIQLDVCVVRDEAGAALYSIAQIQDITNRRQLEEQFRQSQKMEAVGRLAGGVAHDFNNLLTVISGYSELALSRVSDEQSRSESKDMREDLEEIKSAAGRAASLTQQLLAFSRQQVVRPGKLDLNEIVAEIEKMLDRLIGEDIALVVKLDAAVGAVVADAGQLEQVILNLAVNGRDAMPGGGTLTIETADVELEEALDSEHGRAEPGRYVRLAVTDDGSGMDAETRARVFEPFYTTKELGKGTGLGLSTVYGILEQSGGHVRINSAPGRGTSFEIYLPECARADAGRGSSVRGQSGGRHRDDPARRRRGVRPRPHPANARGKRVQGAVRSQRERGPTAVHRQPRAHRPDDHRRRDASDARRRSCASRRTHPPRPPGAVHVRLHRQLDRPGYRRARSRSCRSRSCSRSSSARSATALQAQPPSRIFPEEDLEPLLDEEELAVVRRLARPSDVPRRRRRAAQATRVVQLHDLEHVDDVERHRDRDERDRRDGDRLPQVPARRPRGTG